MTSGRPDYTSQALIRGNCSGVGILTVAVDASGNILGVLRGDYAGTPKTLAVDDQGRMLAVLTDPEDVFGNPHYIGAAELAARLGSPAMYDRRGQVMFMDPGGVAVQAYSYVVSGSGSDFVEYGGAAPGLGICYKLEAGWSDNDYVLVEKRCPRLWSTKCGHEIMVAIDSTAGQFDLMIAAFDGTNKLTAGIRFDVEGDKWYYRKSDGTWGEIGSLPFEADPRDPHVCKLVIDAAAAKYAKFRLDQTETDLSSHSLQSEADTTGPSLWLRWQLTAGAAGGTFAYVNNIVMTVNEE